MNTFLPYPSFAHSVACLDRARLGKQRIECDQILRALAAAEAPETLGGRIHSGWQRHPAVKMWRGCEAALGVYMTLATWEWQARGYHSSIILPYSRSRLRNEAHASYARMTPTMEEAVPPSWLGREEVHASHRARLLAKLPEHYGLLGWSEQPRSESEGYVWPAADRLLGNSVAD